MKDYQPDEFDFEKDYEKISRIQPPKEDEDAFLFEEPPRRREPSRPRQTARRMAELEQMAQSDQNNSKRNSSRGRTSYAQRRKNRSLTILTALLSLAIGCGIGFGTGYFLWGRTEEKPYTVSLRSIEAPDWIEQKFIRKNIFSRPDVSMKRVDNIVIHYVANPGTSAESNRLYFDSLADQDAQKSGTSASSHFIVGLEGEILQCIPVSEMAYANAPRNSDTVSIEVCHPDDSGKFNDETYDSVVKLTAWLCEELKLSAEDVVRHYDINEKNCPKYFVEHEDAWEQFIKDVKDAIKENAK